MDKQIMISISNVNYLYTATTWISLQIMCIISGTKEYILQASIYRKF